MICPACKKEVPEDSTFCLSCGRPLKDEGVDIITPPEGSNTENRAMIYMILAIMFLFFGCFLLIPGYFVGPGMMIPATVVAALGVVFLAARYRVLGQYTKKVEKLRKEAAVRVKCRYCGTLNSESAEKCESCGAGL